jgi:hypothetical protein
MVLVSPVAKVELQRILRNDQTSYNKMVTGLALIYMLGENQHDKTFYNSTAKKANEELRKKGATVDIFKVSD